MSLNFCKGCSSCLYKNVCFMTRNPGLLSGGFHDKVVSILSFYFFAKRKNLLFRIFVGRTGGWFQLHTSRFALLAQVATFYSRRKCISFPLDLTVVQKWSFCSDFWVRFWLIVLRNAHVKPAFCVKRYQREAIGALQRCWAWNMATSISASEFGRVERFPQQL